jgi:hypothetical protein
MRTMPILGMFLLCPFLLADDPPSQPGTPDVPKADYAEFSKLVHNFVVKGLPKDIEHRDGWGATIPHTEKLILPRLRTYLKDGERIVLPHGAWKRLKVQLEDPAKDLVISVKDFRYAGGKNYRLDLEADVVLRTEGEWQQWQKGLLLVGVEGVADAYLHVSVGADIGVELDFKQFPPGVKIHPKVTDLGLDLEDIRLRGGPIFTGEKGERLASDIKGLIRAAVKAAEPQVKKLANEAIAESIQKGRGALSPGELFKSLPPGEREKKNGK